MKLMHRTTVSGKAEALCKAATFSLVGDEKLCKSLSHGFDLHWEIYTIFSDVG